MNEKGLTVTLNASKSDIPTSASTPISLLAREILQYAGNIREAIAIAKNRKTFVSESILIGSAADGTTAIIEKGPMKMDVFYSKGDLVSCANHFQSRLFLKEESNTQNMEWTDSKSRFDRVTQLAETKKPLDQTKVAEILRDKNGVGNKDIGLGNARALNQLIAHHAIIFKPESGQFWVSTSPYQLGTFCFYDLNAILKNKGKINDDSTLNIPADDFLTSTAYEQFVVYRKLKERIVKNTLFHRDFDLSEKEISTFIASNPNSYEVYNNLGKYYDLKSSRIKAKEMYKIALSKEIASKAERKSIEEAYSRKDE